MTDVTPLGVGQRIRVQMQRHNMTVPRAAQDSNLPQATFETYLYGRSLPGAVALVGLAKGLRCSTDWLLNGKVAE